MPRVKLMEDPDIAALVGKKVAQVQAAAAKDATRLYKGMVRTIKEALNTANLDRKAVKGLTDHVVSAVSAHAPATPAAE